MTTPPTAEAIAEQEDERKWLVWYHDTDMPLDMFVRGGNAESAARQRHRNMLSAWSCHLFREVFPGEQIAPAADELTSLKAEVEKLKVENGRLREVMEPVVQICERNIYPQPDKPDSLWATVIAPARAALTQEVKDNG